MSPGSSSTGSRLIVASAAPVTMLVAPGPIDEVQASVCSRLRCLGVGDGGVHHRLLVARQVVAQAAVLLQRLADAGDVAVAEDAEHAGEERRRRAVALDLLGGQERDQRLRHRHPHGRHLTAPRVSPRTKWRCTTRAKITIGSAPITPAAAIGPYSIWILPISVETPTGTVCAAGVEVSESAIRKSL